MKTIKALVTGSLILLASVSYGENWSSSPVISEASCSSLEYKDVLSFLTKYYYPTLGYDSKHRDVGAKMMESYAISSSLITRSQICMAEALGLKALSEELAKEQAILTGGTSLSSDEIKKHRKFTASADKQIRKASNDSADLKPEQKKSFGLGVSTYLAGVYATTELADSIEDYTKATKKSMKKKKSYGLGSLTDKLKDPKSLKGDIGTLNTVRVITTGVAGILKDTLKTSKFLMSYSKKKNISISKDATDKLSKSGGW